MSQFTGKKEVRGSEWRVTKTSKGPRRGKGSLLEGNKTSQIGRMPTMNIEVFVKKQLHENVREKAPVLAAVANTNKETSRFPITSDWFLGRTRPWKSKYVKDDPLWVRILMERWLRRSRSCIMTKWHFCSRAACKCFTLIRRYSWLVLHIHFMSDFIVF